MTSSPIKIFYKTTAERRRLTVDYSCFLDDTEKLIDMQYTISPYTAGAPLLVDSSFPDAAQKKVVLFTSGGLSGQSYVVELLARTDSTRIKEDNIGFKVTP